MVKIKIFATPEAYQTLTNPNTSEEAQTIVQDLFDQMKNKTDRERDSYHSKSSLGISAIWAKNSYQTSVALIYQSELILGIKHLINPDFFWNDISTAIPIDLI